MASTEFLDINGIPLADTTARKEIVRCGELDGSYVLHLYSDEAKTKEVITIDLSALAEVGGDGDGSGYVLTAAKIVSALGYTPIQTDTNTTYTMSQNGNEITITGSDGYTKTITVASEEYELTADKITEALGYTPQGTLTDADKQTIADMHTDKVTSVNGQTGDVTLSIPSATTVIQTLASGTEIGSVNGIKFYAPSGEGGTTVIDATVDSDELETAMTEVFGDE